MNNLQGHVLYAQYPGYLRCQLCDTPVLLLYFDVCHINLCKGCAANHLLDNSVEHKVVPIKQKHLLLKRLKATQTTFIEICKSSNNSQTKIFGHYLKH